MNRNRLYDFVKPCPFSRVATATVNYAAGQLLVLLLLCCRAAAGAAALCRRRQLLLLLLPVCVRGCSNLAALKCATTPPNIVVGLLLQ